MQGDGGCGMWWVAGGVGGGQRRRQQQRAPFWNPWRKAVLMLESCNESMGEAQYQDWCSALGLREIQPAAWSAWSPAATAAAASPPIGTTQPPPT